MSGFKHYEQELHSLDHEILHCAAMCGVNIANRHEIDTVCLDDGRFSWAARRARESLRGLLMLRAKLEMEMIGLGLTPWPLLPPD
ncbi:MAG: hypothetical protein LBE62_04540 [Azonexus sp.]|jgi:hypothetical protein|nr:hypothetical protein [Azonexus sp.]